jgi:hypothetical protein
MSLENIVVEPSSKGGDIDVQATVDGQNIVFQIKSLCFPLSNYQQTINKCTKSFYDNILNKYGLFAKVLFTSYPQYPKRIVALILERRKVSDTIDASYGVLYFDVNCFQWSTLRRIQSATRKSFKQLKNLSANYRIAVIDISYEAVNQIDVYNYIRRNFAGKKYEELSGIILMTFDNAQGNTAGTRLIPVGNPYAKNPIDWGLIFRKTICPVHRGKQYLLLLPTLIRVQSPGWHDLMHMEPGYRIIYKGKEFGTL